MTRQFTWFNLPNGRKPGGPKPDGLNFNPDGLNLDGLNPDGLKPDGLKPEALTMGTPRYCASVASRCTDLIIRGRNRT